MCGGEKCAGEGKARWLLSEMLQMTAAAMAWMVLVKEEVDIQPRDNAEVTDCEPCVKGGLSLW